MIVTYEVLLFIYYYHEKLYHIGGFIIGNRDHKLCVIFFKRTDVYRTF